MLSDAEIRQQLSKLKEIKPETIIVTDKVLGSGRQGTVSAGVWSGRSVALKKLKSANTLDRESIVEFLKELRWNWLLLTLFRTFSHCFCY